jgi:hypothetical protein
VSGRASHRTLQIVLPLLVRKAEYWLSNRFNAYLQDGDEYRAITRQTIIRGLTGTHHLHPAAITVTFDRPGTAAPSLLLDEINQNPLTRPGGDGPSTYQVTSHH